MIEIIKWSGQDRNIEPYHQKRIDRNNHLLFREALTEAHFPYLKPYSVEIETVNRCNNDCSFCAVNVHNDTRAYHKMSKELFGRILGQLSRMDYRGYLSLFSNNEPLLDPRIYEFLRQARREVPHARLCLFTNGTLLNPERFGWLIESLDYLTIDNYADSGELLPSVASAVEPYRERDFACKVKVLIRRKTQILSSRGGEAPNRNPDHAYEGTCMMPFMQIVVRPDGKVSKCCQDGLGYSCIGDLNRETIEECWHNRRREELWNAMAEHGRRGVEGCGFCDVFGHDNYLPDEWKPMIIQSFVKAVAEQYLRGRKLFLAGSEAHRRKIRRLLAENGMEVFGCVERMEGIKKCGDCFYILEEYEEPFLERLDPLAERAGVDWIVYERIPDYLYHDRTEQVLGFTEILNRFLANQSRRLCFWGGKEAEMLLGTYIRLPEYDRAETSAQADAYIEQYGTDVCMVLAGEEAGKEAYLTKKRGVPSGQIIRLDEILRFTDLL